MRFGRLIAAGCVTLAISGAAAPRVGAESPSPSASGPACFLSLKFAGAIYLDSDQSVPGSEVGPVVGETEPNAAHCGLQARLQVRRHNGHLTTEEVVYVVPATGASELFRSAGDSGFPAQDLLKWLVLVLVVGVLVFAALPVMYAHLLRPPEEVGGADDPDV